MPISPDQILVVIPALNEQVALPGVLADLRQAGLYQIRVVDNGSTDRTADTAREHGAEVIFESRRGYGRACWSGTRNLPISVNWILFCDADGSDDLSILPTLIAAADEAPFVLANRRATPESRAMLTPIQNFGNALSSLLIHLGWGAKFHDLGPLRLIHRKVFEQLNLQDRGFGWTVEMQARIAQEKIPFREIPMSYRPRQGGKSKISGTLKGSLHAGFVILSTLGQLFLKKTSTQSWLTILSSFLILGGTSLMLPHGDFRIPGTVPHFLNAAALASLGFVLCWKLQHIKWWCFWGVVIASRLLLLPMVPGDDLWRYLWEGLIQLKGYCPYLIPPSSPDLISLRTDYWTLINHKDIAAIYPPIALLIFRGMSALSDSALFFKSVFILADLSVCALLARRFGTRAALLYGWNPLIIYSFAGGAHYDSLFLLPLVAAWMLMEPGRAETRPASFTRWAGACLLIGLSVGIKWVSLPLLAFAGIQVWKRFGWRRAVLTGFLGSLPFLMLPNLVCSGIHWSEMIPRDFAMYARSAEWIPRIVAYFWEASSRMNWIYTIPLVLVCVVLIFRCQRWSTMSEWFFFSLLVLSPVVHAWYFTWMIPLCVASRNPGIRLLSISGFVYFILQERTARWVDGMENPWQLTPWESALLWLPFLVGFLFWYGKQRSPEPIS